jgi:hypothetical protein
VILAAATEVAQYTSYSKLDKPDIIKVGINAFEKCIVVLV